MILLINYVVPGVDNLTLFFFFSENVKELWLTNIKGNLGSRNQERLITWATITGTNACILY